MSRAEEQALKAYPREDDDWCEGNVDRRIGYKQGYNQAQQDLMDKAKQWFTDNLPSEKVQLLWNEFELFIAEN